jgi:putative membrane protein
MSRAFVLFAAAALTITAPSVLAQSSPAGPSAARAASADAVFIAKAAETIAADAALARLGAAKALARDVKVFAQRLVQGQSALHRELAVLAKSKGVNLDPSGDDTRQVGADLAPLSGPAFDRAFVAAATRAHEAAVALFESESRDGRDADVKDWAARQLPAIREQLTKVQALKPVSRS